MHSADLFYPRDKILMGQTFQLGTSIYTIEGFIELSCFRVTKLQISAIVVKVAIEIALNTKVYYGSIIRNRYNIKEYQVMKIDCMR